MSRRLLLWAWLLLCPDPALAQLEGRRELVFAHVVAGGGYTTSLAFANADAFPKSVVVDLFDDAGQPLNVPIDGVRLSRFERILPSNGGLHIRVGSIGDDLSVGWARARTTSGVAGWETVQSLSPAGQRITEATVADSEIVYASALEVQLEAAAGEPARPLASQVGIAVANPTGRDIRVRLALVDDTGRFVAAREDVLIPKRGHWARLLAQVFPELEDRKFLGSIRLDAAGSPFAGLSGFFTEEQFLLTPLAAGDRLPEVPSAFELAFDIELPGTVIDVAVDEVLGRVAVTTTTGIHLLQLPDGRSVASFAMPLSPTVLQPEGRLSLNQGSHIAGVITSTDVVTLVDMTQGRLLGERTFLGAYINRVVLPVLGLAMGSSAEHALVVLRCGSTPVFPGREFRLFSLFDSREQSLRCLWSHPQPMMLSSAAGTRAILMQGSDVSDRNQVYLELSYQQFRLPFMDPIGPSRTPGNPLQGYTYDGRLSERPMLDVTRGRFIVPLHGAVATVRLDANRFSPVFAHDRSDYVYDVLSGLVVYSTLSRAFIHFAEPTTGEVVASLDATFTAGRLALSPQLRILVVGDPHSGRLRGYRLR